MKSRSLLIAVVVAELSEGGLDSKALAMLGVLCAINAALRPLGAGTAGIETRFFLLILPGHVLGAGFGFLPGATSMVASALLTGGPGPGPPFQRLPPPRVGRAAEGRRTGGGVVGGGGEGWGVVASAR